MSDPSEAGTRLRAWRESVGLSREALAKEVGIAVGTIRNHETGVSGPKSEHLQKLAMLGCDVGWLLTGRQSEGLKTPKTNNLNSEDQAQHELEAVALNVSSDPIVSERLKNWREARQWTQPELAERLGVSTRSLSRWESGEGLPNGEAIQTLANLGCDPTWLLTGREPSSGVTQSPARTEEAPPLDIGLLSSITGMLEEWLERHQRRMEPNQRGRFIAEAYAFCMEETQHSQTPAVEMAPRVVERFLRLVS